MDFMRLLLNFIAIISSLISGALLYRYFLLRRDPFYKELNYIVNRKGENIYFDSPPAEISRKIAEQRRQAITNAFKKADIPIHIDLSEHKRYLKYKFLEYPTELMEEKRQFFEDSKFEAYGQMARLYWQLHSDELLLAERVVDLIEAMHNRRKNLPEREIGNYPIIHLREQTIRDNKKDILPWHVVIETDNQNFYARELKPYYEWLGVGIAFSPYRGIHPFGKCIDGKGLEGVVGGLLRSYDECYAMTCSHVLSPNCQSVRYKSDLQSHGNQPDAALINKSTPCFDIPKSTSRCACATSDEIKKFALNKSMVKIVNPQVSQRKGFIYNQTLAFPLGNIYYRFPHLHIMPVLYNFFGLSRPLFPTPFSRPGDSGSWVFDFDSDKWLGMLIGGDDIFLGSYVVEAQPLLNFFNGFISPNNNTSKESNFKPETYVR